MTNAVIVDIVRTASGKGKPGGALSEVHPVDLLATVLRALAGIWNRPPARVLCTGMLSTVTDAPSSGSPSAFCTRPSNGRYRLASGATLR